MGSEQQDPSKAAQLGRRVRVGRRCPSATIRNGVGQAECPAGRGGNRLMTQLPRRAAQRPEAHLILRPERDCGMFWGMIAPPDRSTRTMAAQT
jgi:hypothetical protein